MAQATLCYRCRPSSPPQKGGRAPKFSAHVYCGQTAGWIKMPLDIKVGLDTGHILLDGDHAPPSSKEDTTPFSAHVCYGQTALWIKMLLSIEVGLGPGHIVLDGDPAPFPKGGTAPPQIFGHVCCSQTAGWIKMPLGMKLGIGLGHIVLDGDPAPPKRGTASQFSAHIYCGQTVDHLSYCRALV